MSHISEGDMAESDELNDVSQALVSIAIVSVAIVSVAIVSIAIVSVAIVRMGLPLRPTSQAAWM